MRVINQLIVNIEAKFGSSECDNLIGMKEYAFE